MSFAAPLVLRPGDESKLTALLRATTVRAGIAQRARIVLLAAEGMSNVAISRLVGVSRPTVLEWRNRYTAGGIGALQDLERSGRPPVIDDAAVVVATLQAPPASLGVTHWSARLLARQLGISFASVARIWREWNLQPWRQETFKFSAGRIAERDHTTIATVPGGTTCQLLGSEETAATVEPPAAVEPAAAVETAATAVVVAAAAVEPATAVVVVTSAGAVVVAAGVVVGVVPAHPVHSGEQCRGHQVGAHSPGAGDQRRFPPRLRIPAAGTGRPATYPPG